MKHYSYFQLQKFWRFLARLLAISVNLIPHNDIQPKPSKNADHRKWTSIGVDPQFLIRKSRLNPRRTFTSGWYLVQVQINYQQQTNQVAKLYFESTKEDMELTSVQFPLRPHKNTSRFIYINEPCKHIRFDPIETSDEFELTTFRIAKVPSYLAVKRQHKRVCKLHPEFASLTRLQCHKKIQELAKNSKNSRAQLIIKLYSETFPAFEIETQYDQWIEKNEAPKLRKFLGVHANTNSLTPKISIILPVYNTAPEHLKHCLESVFTQTYQNWQLCIVDDASTSKEHLIVLDDYRKDERVSFHQKTQNGHISVSSNDALSMVQGEYTLLLDHDDALPKHCLELFVIAINHYPKAQLFYADEDKIDDFQKRQSPHFKPEWNADLLYSQNYIGHPVVYQTQRLKDIEGFMTGVEGSQDHDLLLRYTKNLTCSEVIHLPWILYHWRISDSSTASNIGSKSYTESAGIKALQNFFSSKKLAVKVSSGTLPNTYKCEFPLPKNPPLVSLIIPTHNGFDILKTCVESILSKTTYKNYELIIVDNNTSCTKTLNYLKKLDQEHNQIRILEWHFPFNYSAINNFAVKHAYGEVIGLINNDIEVITPNWLTEMVAHAIRPEIGCVGAKLYYPNDTIQHAGVILGIGGVAGHSHKYFEKHDSGYYSRLHLTQNLSAVTAACLIVEKSIFKQVNGLDEENLTVAFNDVDFCLKVREAGFNNLFTPWAELYHHESISRGAEDNPKKQKRAQQEIQFMKKKWGTALYHDPAYNRNLTLTYENFTLR